MEEKYFLVQIKRTGGTIEKGVVVKDTLEAAKQSYHAYLGAYAYNNNAQTDYVQCAINDMSGATVVGPEIWQKQEVQNDNTIE